MTANSRQMDKPYLVVAGVKRWLLPILAASSLTGCLQVIGVISDSTTRTQVSIAGGAFGAVPASGTYVTIVDKSIPNNPITRVVQSTDTTQVRAWYNDWIRS